MKKKLIIAFLVASATILTACASTSESKPMDYYAYADNLDLMEIIDTNDLTMEMLESRNGKTIIERCIGVVDNAETGEGHVLGNENFYISYSCIDDISKGDVICTYFVYNPDNNYYDDIISRFDYVIDTAG